MSGGDKACPFSLRLSLVSSRPGVSSVVPMAGLCYNDAGVTRLPTSLHRGNAFLSGASVIYEAENPDRDVREKYTGMARESGITNIKMYVVGENSDEPGGIT